MYSTFPGYGRWALPFFNPDPLTWLTDMRWPVWSRDESRAELFREQITHCCLHSWCTLDAIESVGLHLAMKPNAR